MNPKQFLLIGGVILLALGIFGFISPTPVENRTTLHFDVYENWSHTLLGIAAIVFGLALPKMLRWWVTALVGVTAVGFTIAGFAITGRAFPNLGGANLENPIDNVLHLVVGVWALGVAAYTWRDMRSTGMMEEEMAEEEKMHRAA